MSVDKNVYPEDAVVADFVGGAISDVARCIAEYALYKNAVSVIAASGDVVVNRPEVLNNEDHYESKFCDHMDHLINSMLFVSKLGVVTPDEYAALDIIRTVLHDTFLDVAHNIDRWSEDRASSARMRRSAVRMFRWIAWGEPDRPAPDWQAIVLRIMRNSELFS